MVVDRAEGEVRNEANFAGAARGEVRTKAGGCQWPNGGVRERGRVAERTQWLGTVPCGTKPIV